MKELEIPYRVITTICKCVKSRLSLITMVLMSQQNIRTLFTLCLDRVLEIVLCCVLPIGPERESAILFGNMLSHKYTKIYKANDEDDIYTIGSQGRSLPLD